MIAFQAFHLRVFVISRRFIYDSDSSNLWVSNKKPGLLFQAPVL